MTENGTHRLDELDYFPCTCPKCTSTTPKQASELAKEERTVFLAEHNLHMCSAELKRIKQAIKDGRLWEHLEMRAHSHPTLLQAVKKLAKYQDFMEKHAPTVKDSGLFFFSSLGLIRPEVIHYRRNLAERYAKPKQARTLLLMPQTQIKPFHKSQEYKRIAKAMHHSNSVHVCFYAAPFGIIPIELDEVYPLSQHETALPLDRETIDYVANQVADYINRTNYKTIILLDNPENWDRKIRTACKKVCRKKKIKFTSVNITNANLTGKLCVLQT
jgi:7-cyano-7-deazaguanine tRNA-ribosyltransferase